MGLELDIIVSSLLGRGRMLFQGRMIARHRNQYNNTQRQSTGSSSNNNHHHNNNNNNSIHKSTGKILPKNVDIDGKPIVEKSIFSIGTNMHTSNSHSNTINSSSSKGKGGSISNANDMLYHFMTDWKSQYILLIEIHGKGMLIVLDPYTHMVCSIVHLDRVTGVSIIIITTITITTTASTTYSTLFYPLFALISSYFPLI